MLKVDSQVMDFSRLYIPKKQIALIKLASSFLRSLTTSVIITCVFFLALAKLKSYSRWLLLELASVFPKQDSCSKRCRYQLSVVTYSVMVFCFNTSISCDFILLFYMVGVWDVIKKNFIVSNQIYRLKHQQLNIELGTLNHEVFLLSSMPL